MEVLNAHSWAPLKISWLRICIFTRSPRWCGHTLIFENLTADHIFKDIYLQRKSELIQIKTVWISIHICDKPCSLSKNTWETFGYSILLIKLRHGDSSLQRQWVPLNHRLHYLNAVEGQFIPWPAALPQACPPRNWSVPPWAGLPLVPSSNSCCAGDISQLLSARKCKHMYLCASHIHITTSVQSLSCVRLFATPWIAAPQASLSITNSQSLPKLISIELVMPSSHLILCRPLFLLPPIPPSLLLGRKAMTNLDSIFKSRDITLPTKVHLVKAMVFPVVMYGCESWTVKKAKHRRIDAFELWCWRRLLGVPWTARRSNQSILKEISPGCSLEGLMLKLKLQ